MASNIVYLRKTEASVSHPGLTLACVVYTACFGRMHALQFFLLRYT